MAEEQEIEVKLEEPVEVEQKKEPEVAAASDDEAISELKRQYDELKKRDETRTKAVEDAQRVANEATNQAQRAIAEAEQAKTQVVGTELQSVSGKLTAAKDAADAAEREYTAAMEQGNWAEAAKAQRRLSKAEADQVAFDRDKKYLESQEAARVTEGRVEQRQPNVDPVESALSTMAPKVREYVREHLDILTDPEMRAKAQAAHIAAGRKGLTPAADADGYVRFCDEYLYGTQVETQPTQQRRTMPAAPPSREPSSSPTNTAKVKLTPGEVERANDGSLVFNTGPNKGKPIGVQEMARRKALLEKEGAYTRRLPQ